MSETSVNAESPVAAASPRMRRTPGWALWLIAVLAVAVAAAGGMYWHRQRAPRCFARALQALDAGRLEEAARALEGLGDAAAYAPHRHFLRGALLLGKKQYYGALDEFGHSVDHPELRLQTLTLSGQAAYEAVHLQDAIGLLRQATDMDADWLPALRWLASACYDLGLTDDAVRHLTRIAELDSDDPRPHRLMGLMYKDFENYPAAVAHYRESLRRDPQQSQRDRIVLELAECEIKLRQFDSALATLEACTPCADRWAQAAECQYGLDRRNEARLLLDQALRREPAHLSGLLLAGTMAQEQGDLTAAVAAFSRAVVARPKDYTARFKLAQACRRASKREEADKHTRAAEEIKRLREEFSKLHEKAAAEPGNADVRCRLGVLARELDRPDLARIWFRAALAIDGRHADTLRQLAGASPSPPPQTPPRDRGAAEPR